MHEWCKDAADRLAAVLTSSKMSSIDAWPSPPDRRVNFCSTRCSCSLVRCCDDSWLYPEPIYNLLVFGYEGNS